MWRAGQKIDAWCVRGAGVVRSWCAGCCPALAEGRAEKFGAPDWCLGALLVLPNVALVRQICVLAMPQQNAALPSRRAGQCFQNEVPRSKLGCYIRYPFSLAFLVPK